MAGSFLDFLKTNSTGIGALGQLLGGAGQVYAGVTNADMAKQQAKLAQKLVANQQDKEEQFQSNLNSAFQTIYGG